MENRALVLNNDYQAIAVCSAERAFVLVYLKKAELVADCPDRRLRSVSSAWPWPSIIRLNRFVRTPFRKVALNRANVFRRDGCACVYCNSRKDLTLDHVTPRAHGGRDSWENLVTACQSCNTHKGNRTPEQAGMKMLRPPFRPSYIMFLSNFSNTVNDDWRPYLMI